MLLKLLCLEEKLSKFNYMNVVFRIDASNRNGMGHLSRCCNLAESISEKGYKVYFILRFLDKKFKRLFNKKNYRIIILPKNKFFKDEKKINVENIWSKKLQKIDAKDTKKIIAKKKIDLLIIDHYGLNFNWEKILSSKVKKSMVISDFVNRKHFCDYFLNQNVENNKEKLVKKFLPRKCQIFLGTEYSLLNKKYYDLKNKIKIKPKKVNKILLSFGGTDVPFLVRKFLNIFESKKFKGITLTIVANQKIKNFSKVKKVFYLNPNSLEKIIFRSDFSIGGGGITNLEKMCLGVPSLAIPLSENQKESLKNLKKKNLIYFFKNYKSLKTENLLKFIFSIINSKNKFYLKRLKIFSLIDGLGSLKICEALFPSKISDLKIRKTQMSDLPIYFNWVNEKNVVKNSFTNKKIGIKEHSKWFKNKIKSKKTSMYVLEVCKLPIGQVRFEASNNKVKIDYSLDNIVRDRKWGKAIIKLGIKELKLPRIKFINAEVKKQNKKSISIFKNLGFREGISHSKYFYSANKQELLRK